MAAPLIIFVGIIYLVIAIDLLIKGQTGLGLAFIGYSASNGGLYLAARGG